MPANRPKLGEVRAAEGAGAAELTTRERGKIGGYRRFTLIKLDRRLRIMECSLINDQFIARVVQLPK